MSSLAKSYHECKQTKEPFASHINKKVDIVVNQLVEQHHIVKSNVVQQFVQAMHTDDVLTEIMNMENNSKKFDWLSKTLHERYVKLNLLDIVFEKINPKENILESNLMFIKLKDVLNYLIVETYLRGVVVYPNYQTCVKLQDCIDYIYEYQDHDLMKFVFNDLIQDRHCLM